MRASASVAQEREEIGMSEDLPLTDPAGQTMEGEVGVMKTAVDLKVGWGERLKLRAEGNKLRAEGNKLRAEGNKLYAEGDKLYAEGDKLWAEGDKLYAEGNKLWAEAIIEAYGNIKLQWIWRNGDYACKLETGEVFEPTSEATDAPS